MTLREAVLAANANPGPDRIIINDILNQGVKLDLSESGGGGTLRITDSVEIVAGENFLGMGATIDGLGQMRPFQVQGEGVAVTFSNLTIQNGLATSGSTTASGGRAEGGAIRVIGGAGVTLNNVHFVNNAALGPAGSPIGSAGWDARGGAVFVDEGNLTLINSTFVGNRAVGGNATGLGGNRGGGGSGGAIYFDTDDGGGSLTIEQTLFEDNLAEGGRSTTGALGRAGIGGAIWLTGNEYELTITDAQFKNNTARGGRINSLFNPEGVRGGQGVGGAIATSSDGSLLSTSVAISNSLFEGNEAIGADGENVLVGDAGFGGGAQGGAIAAGAGWWNVRDSAFVENQAIAGNGGWVRHGQAGEGGFAHGGAIAVAGGSVLLNLVGELDTVGPDGDPDKLTSTTLFLNNVALGGSGGEKQRITGDAGVSDFDTYAGAGGDAQGGAISVVFPVTALPSGLLVDQVAFVNNGALAGNGGDGNLFEVNAAGQVTTDYADSGSDSNGTAKGGAIFSMGFTGIEDSAFTHNLAAGARYDDDLLSDVASGSGGTRPNGQGALGTLGGDAYGGAIFQDGRAGAGLRIGGSSFFSNQALGSTGGTGGAGGSDVEAEFNRGGQGGAGGNAAGGAIRAETLLPTEIETSVFFANSALGGRGGVGGQAGPSVDGRNGGLGGWGGNAEGGAISVVGLTGGTSLLLEEVYLRDNYVLAGDGGFGGRGGVGVEYGGRGGFGGRGGDALGGGIHAENADVEMSRSTVEANRVSSGYGGSGAYGGRAGWVGGDGGRGSDAGVAAGGGIAVEDGTLTADRSTIVFNQVQSGFGGNGGFGNRGIVEGGSGGNGGDGGDALGGGIWTDRSSSSSQQVDLFATTVVGNAVESGGGGFAGTFGGVDFTQFDGELTIYSDLYTPQSTSDNPAYRYVWGSGIVDGSAGILSGRAVGSGVASNDPFHSVVYSEFNTVVHYQPSGPGEVEIRFEQVGIDEAAVGTFGVVDVASYGAIATGLAASATAGVAVGVAAGITVTASAGEIALIGAEVAAETLSWGFSASAGLSTAGGVFAGLALPTAIGGVLLARFLTAGIESGDWGAAFEYAIAPAGPINANNRTLAVLFPFSSGDDDDDDPLEDAPFKWDITKTNGAAGNRGMAAGAGIWANGSLDQTLVSDNSAFERSRTRSVGVSQPSYENLEAGLFNIPNRHWFVQEHNEQVDAADVQGAFTSAGTNFIGAANAGFTNDIHGTPANPLSAKIDSQTRFNGGPLPTIKLLPGSPARQAISIDQPTVSQNEFEWIGTADVGAWGGLANRAPATTYEVEVKEDGQLTIAIADDPDNDPLSLVGSAPAANNGTILFHDDGTFTYTPDADWFGQETLTYQVSDGEFTVSVTTAIDVLPVNDPPVLHTLPPTEIPEDTVFDFDLWALVTDIDTPAELLQFEFLGVSQIGTFAVLDNGRTARFTPTPNAVGNPIALLEVTDPGDGAGPVHTVSEFISFTITPVNDAPVNVLPASPVVDEDSQITFGGVQVTDVDVAAGDNQMRVSLIVGNGTLSLSDLTDLVFDEGNGTDDEAMSFTGSLEAINAALAELTYRPSPNFNGTDQLNIISNDLGNFGEGGPMIDEDLLDIIVNAVNDAPVVTVPGAQTGYEDVQLVFHDISVDDIDVGEGTGEVQVTLGVEHGTVTLSQIDGLTFTEGDGTGDAAMTFLGTLADVNAALLGMYYLGDLNYSGPDMLTLEVNDLGNTGLGGPLADSATVSISLLSWREQTDLLIEQVNTLNKDGVLNKGQTNGLLSKLKLLSNSGDADKVRGFIDNVEGHLADGTLTEEQAEPLLTAGGILLASITNSDR